MTKLAGTGETIRRRYREMAAAATKCAAETKTPRDRSVYLALAKGWEALAEALDEAAPRPPARRKKPPKKDGAG